jgi:sugar O-acyltransferase (sialic acid O-acetyltransferase NeuD family)
MTGPQRRPRVVVFGDGPVGEVVHAYLGHDSPYEVVAFTVDGSHLRSSTKRGVPVVAFERVQDLFPPDDVGMIVALGWREMNQLRAARYEAARSLGYQLISYVSTAATVAPGVEIGDNCIVLDGTIVQPFATIGADVVLWSGSHIGHHSRIGDHCFVSPHALVASDVTMGSHCFVGASATIRDGIDVERETLIGAGALIMKDTRPREVYVGATATLLPLSSDRLPPSMLGAGTHPNRG